MHCTPNGKRQTDMMTEVELLLKAVLLLFVLVLFKHMFKLYVPL